MGIYKKYIFPYLLDLCMTRRTLEKHRRELLSEVGGEILEIGFGTGANLQFYPKRVERVTAIDGNRGMNKRGHDRIKSSPIEVKHLVANAESLPFAEGSFDSVVSSFTLCSIRDVDRALSEVLRVLRRGGRYFFLEHGLSHEPGIQKWQHRLTPLSRALADSCHMNRDIGELIEAKPFKIAKLERFYIEDSPRVTGYIYRGTAVKG